jgi:hypothetical protein
MTIGIVRVSLWRAAAATTAAARIMLVIGAAPAFASPANDAEWNITPQAPAATCHFVREPVTLSNGRVVHREAQVCS